MKNDKLYLMDDKKEKVLDYLKERKAVLLYGPPGIGKTALVFEIAKEKKWKLIRINSSDLRTKEELLPYFRMIRTRNVSLKIGKKKIGTLLFLFDEVDGTHDWNFLRKMLINAGHPVIMTANREWKIPKWVFKKAKNSPAFVRTMKFYAPRQADIVEILRSKGIDGNFTGITRDVRSAQSVLKYGSVSEREYTDFDNIKYMINFPKTIPKRVLEEGKWKFKTHWMSWFMHNLPRFHRGFPLFQALEIMSMVDLYNDPNMLQFLPETMVGGKGQDAKYPEYLQVIKKYKYKKKG